MCNTDRPVSRVGALAAQWRHIFPRAATQPHEPQGTTETGGPWGDSLGPRADSDLRVTLLNVDSLPADRRSDRIGEITEWWRRDEVNIALLTEVGHFWPAVPEEDQWHNYIRDRIPSGSQSNLAYNRHDTRSRAECSRQYGGTGVVVVGEDHHRVGGRGQDTTGLGRWAWTRIRGRDGTGIVLISTYRPNRSITGASTVWSQHRTYLSNQGDDADPQKAFMRDLCTAISQWRTSGDHVVLGMDANDDLRNGLGPVRKALDKVGMREALLTRHYDKSPQATYNRNTNNKPIDGIFVSPSIQVSGGGYYGWDEAIPSTHRALWLDIPRSSLGVDPHLPCSFAARR